ncbi:hypothetical protein CHS0354_004089 [Potamilus streckersoni]|uniref:Uncharacterized protein n=1 Tax=Potamilus streckersoni TaxID=2493646 RepID=A0AAE0SK51_9BIVA|nr:hypothetical protein CHS0354_004089 [Potamilus streckersoni]
MIQEGDSHQNHYDQQTSPNYGIALPPNTTIRPYSYDRFFIITARSCCTCPTAIYSSPVTMYTLLTTSILVPVIHTPFEYGFFDSTQTTTDNPSMYLKQTIPKYKSQASSYSLPSDLFQCKKKNSQESSETVLDYLTRLLQIANNKTIPNQILLAVALQGLKPAIKTIVMNQNPTNMDDLRKAAIKAEQSIDYTDNNNNSSTLNALLEELKQIKDEIKAVSSEQNMENNNSFSQSFVSEKTPQFRSQRPNYQHHNLSYQPAKYSSSSISKSRSNYRHEKPHDAYYHSQLHSRSQTFCLGCGGLCISRRVCRAQ